MIQFRFVERMSMSLYLCNYTRLAKQLIGFVVSAGHQHR